MKKDQKIRIVERMVACTTTDTIGSCGCRMYVVSGYMSGITCPLNINFVLYEAGSVGWQDNRPL